MSTAGGALVGAKIGFMVGGPVGAGIGAIIGAVAGFTAGMIRKMIKSAEDKMIDKIKSIYGVTISKQLATQFVALAKDQYGGDLDMAAYSPQVRDIVQLYAMATGQKISGGVPRPMYGVEMAQSKGQVFMQPQYQNGQIVPSPYNGPTTVIGGPVQPVYVQLNPQQANALLEGRVVQVIDDNPQAVSKSQANATKSGTNRKANQGASMEPLTTMA
jgi:Glycine zipper